MIIPFLVLFGHLTSNVTPSGVVLFQFSNMLFYRDLFLCFTQTLPVFLLVWNAFFYIDFFAWFCKELISFLTYFELDRLHVLQVRLLLFTAVVSDAHTQTKCMLNKYRMNNASAFTETDNFYNEMFEFFFYKYQYLISNFILDIKDNIWY